MQNYSSFIIVLGRETKCSEATQNWEMKCSVGNVAMTLRLVMPLCCFLWYLDREREWRLALSRRPTNTCWPMDWLITGTPEIATASFFQIGLVSCLGLQEGGPYCKQMVCVSQVLCNLNSWKKKCTRETPFREPYCEVFIMIILERLKWNMCYLFASVF